ncbi:exported hypothetical protein [Candidatus Sulfopaludibacter sp. SbA4]|nr:exported hypothetical protein [Candidatus Sulfopaludibacter sp. SbA4]
MKTLLSSVILVVGVLGIASNGHAQPTYLKVCSPYGAGFYYIPGTDICIHALTGDTREASTAGVWRSQLPYPEGEWVSDPVAECGKGDLVKIGTFKSTDFTLDTAGRKETPPFSLPLYTSQFISEVMMQGGFYDPRTPGRAGVNGAGFPPTDGLCLRERDPDVYFPELLTSTTPPFDSFIALFSPNFVANLAVGCVSNSRIVNMPSVYSIAATLAYPQITDAYDTADAKAIGPVIVGDQLVVTTDYGPTGPLALTYCDASAGGTCGGGDLISSVTDPITQVITNTYAPVGTGVKPLAGTVSVWACVLTAN